MCEEDLVECDIKLNSMSYEKKIEINQQKLWKEERKKEPEMM